MSRRLSLLLFLCTIPVAAQDRSLQPNADIAFDQFSKRDKVITPGLMVYGVPWTASIDDFKREFGPPTGMFSVRNDAVALIYGRSHVFLFEKGELREVSIDRRLFNYVLEPHVLPHPFFDAQDSVIAPGLKLGMTPAEIMKLLPGKFSPPGDHDNSSLFVLDHASVKVWYAFVRRPDEPKTREVMSITLRGM